MMTEAKRTPKGTSKRTAAGRAAVKKGDKFENDVADIYRLLGADVTQNIEICAKKVDVFAVFRLPGSATEHRVIIECKDEKKGRAKNQRVMQFKGLLDTARKAGDADSAEIITRVPWSDQAKGFAREAGIELLTYEEKISQLINFSLYLKDSKERFEKGDKGRPHEPPLAAYYVNPSAEINIRGKIKKYDSIDEYIYKWLQEKKSKQHLAVLGEYGTGKTSLAQKLAHGLASSCLKDRSSTRIPILFNLRDFTKTLKIESLVTSFLDQECGVTNPRFRLFEAMNNAGMFLLILDGFDEMAVKVDADTLEINLHEIEKLSISPKAKIMITSRLEYFISGEEEKKALHPKGDLLATREIGYDIIRIVPWESTQIHEYLKRRVPLIKDAKHPWTYYRRRIEDVPGLADLSKRPVLLDMIVKTLPQLISSDIPINRPNLYKTYLMGEIKRQKIIKRRSLLISDEDRLLLLQRLALDIYNGEIEGINFDDALKYIENHFNLKREDLVAYTRDFLTCSFLIRRGDKFVFSHRSIMEYLIACALLEEIERDIPEGIGFHKLDFVVADFLAELNPNNSILLKWLDSTKSDKIGAMEFLGGNSATLLCRNNETALAKNDLSRANLTGAYLVGADLRETILDGAIMRHVNLSKARFYKDKILGAQLVKFYISLLIYGEFDNLRIAKFKNKKGGEIYVDFIDKLVARSRILKCGKYTWHYDLGKSFRYLAILKLTDKNDFFTIENDLTSIPQVKSFLLYEDNRTDFINSIEGTIDDFISRFDIIQDYAD